MADPNDRIPEIQDVLMELVQARRALATYAEHRDAEFVDAYLRGLSAPQVVKLWAAAAEQLLAGGTVEAWELRDIGASRRSVWSALSAAQVPRRRRQPGDPVQDGDDLFSGDDVAADG